MECNFWQGAASSGISSGFASGADALGLGAVGTILAGGLSGGVASELFGGSFWDGARNGLITSGLNHLSQHREPWDLNGDGKLSKMEADNWWVKGGGKPITVDNSNIDWSGLKIPKDIKSGQRFTLATHEAFIDLPWETATTYGGTAFEKINDNTAKVINQDYHYKYRNVVNSGFLKHSARNIGTFIGHPGNVTYTNDGFGGAPQAHYHLFKGKDFLIRYSNSTIKTK